MLLELRGLAQVLHLTHCLWKGVRSTAMQASAGKTLVLQAGQRGAAGGVQPILSAPHSVHRNTGQLSPHSSTRCGLDTLRDPRSSHQLPRRAGRNLGSDLQRSAGELYLTY